MSTLNSRWLTRLLLAALPSLALSSNAPAEETAKAETAATPKPSPEQPRRAPRPGDVQKVLVIKHLKPRILGEILVAFPATITYSTYGESSGLGVSAAPAVMAAIEETVKRLDVPPAPKTNVEITAYIIQGLAAAEASTSVPPVLAPVVDQLKSAFRYTEYRLIDTLIARGAADGRHWLTADAVSEADIWPKGRGRYSLQAVPALVTADGPSTIRLGEMQFTLKLPAQTDPGSTTSYTMEPVRIRADVDIPVGQYVVVGKSGTGQPGNALILVLSAKVVD